MALAPSHTPHPAGVEFGSLLGLLFFFGTVVFVVAFRVFDFLVVLVNGGISGDTDGRMDKEPR